MKFLHKLEPSYRRLKRSNKEFNLENLLAHVAPSDQEFFRDLLGRGLKELDVNLEKWLDEAFRLKDLLSSDPPKNPFKMK